jgi:hypothetical protein
VSFRVQAAIVVMLATTACHKKAAAPAASGPQNVTINLEGGAYELVSIPPGVQCNGGTTCVGTFDAGTRITVRGQADFPQVDFDGPCEQKFVHTCTFVVTGPITLTATFHTPSN